MKPIRTKTTNAIYEAEGCGDLPVTYYKEDDEVYIESCWELTSEEIKQVQETGKIYLSIRSEVVPPVSLSTETFIE